MTEDSKAHFAFEPMIRGMVISDIQLESKSGGASGEWTRGN